MTTKSKYKSTDINNLISQPWQPKIIGQGISGIVVSPAPYNIDKKGRPINYSNKIAKIMHDKNEFNNSVKYSIELKNKLPTLKQEFIPYQRQFKLNNLPLNDKNEILRGNIPYYVARMDYLGESIKDIIQFDDIKQKLNKIPVEIIIKQIIKVYKLLKEFRDAGFFHNDLNEGNILINPNNGEINIIDFAFARTIDDYTDSSHIFIQIKKILHDYSYNISDLIKHIGKLRIEKNIPYEDKYIHDKLIEVLIRKYRNYNDLCYLTRSISIFLTNVYKSNSNYQKFIRYFMENIFTLQNKINEKNAQKISIKSLDDILIMPSAEDFINRLTSYDYNQNKIDTQLLNHKIKKNSSVKRSKQLKNKKNKTKKSKN